MSEPLPFKEHKFEETYFPPGIKVFFVAIGLFGLALMWFENLAGIIPMVACTLALVTPHGYEYNFESKKYRHFFKILKFTFGRWRETTGVQGIIVSKEVIKEKSKSFSLTSISTQISVWQLSLKIAGEDDELFLHETENIKDACTVILIIMAMTKVMPYSKFVDKKRRLDYPLLRKGVISFGKIVMK